MAAGRCISTAHEALATTRLTPSCMATGQAAGTAAAQAVRRRVTPAEADIVLLQQDLKRQGAILN